MDKSIEVAKYRIERLQRRIEYNVVKQRNYLRRRHEASEELDKELIKYMDIIIKLREEVAGSLL